MSDVMIRREGRAGRITLNRPAALNALTHAMCLAIDAALRGWADDDAVAVVLIDAAGERAFCAGGDIAEMHAAGRRNDHAYGRRFWADEYRMNARIAQYRKPVVSFLQGFTMGGGVGVGCHASHRIVATSSQIAMPECGIGLVPDVGGSYLLARAPGRLGEYLATTGARMGPGDAIVAGFADIYLPETGWEALKSALIAGGDAGVITGVTAPESPLAALAAEIDGLFAGETAADILRALRHAGSGFAATALAALMRAAPLSVACAVEMLHRLRGATATMRRALEMEYRFTARAMEHADFLEGIRAAIIDKDRNPRWRHASVEAVSAAEVARMLMPLGAETLTFTEDQGMKIGFIGLGNMGAPMARNLVAAGHAVSGYDTAAPMPAGVIGALSAASAAKDADVVITMLPSGAILRSVADEVIPAMKPGAVLCDCSTVDVESARAVADQAAGAGVLAIDAPVSGGVGGAAAGTLTFMAGGPDAAFAVVAPLFDIMGQKAVHCGTSGAGQSAKICNNMILGVTMIATCEAFALADKLGLDRARMFDVVSTSSGYSWVMNAYCPAPGIGPKSPADNGYKPGFAAELMLKDLRLSQQAAEAVDADTPMGALAARLYASFVEAEGGRGKDFSAMLPRFEKRHRG